MHTVTEKNLVIGRKVIRGKDWDFPEYQDDYGKSIGMIMSPPDLPESDGEVWVDVLWLNNRHNNRYRIKLLHDLYYCKKEIIEIL